jgi:hypothetical protein
MLLTCLNLLSEFATYIAEVMEATVVYVELVLIVKILSRTEEAMGVLFIDVLM